MCHYCGYEENSVKICPKCGSKYVSGFRAGTEQIEEILNREFISAKVLRMDMDTTKGKDGHEKILSSFANHEADILVGTQMIVKGHDFPDVTLVGILAADMSLYGNDYASAERTYQLLVQASGRAGRAGKPGEVVIQSYTPEHYSIVTASANDYNTFYDEEIEYRKLLGYPPAQNMLKVAFSMKDVGRLETACEDMKRWSTEYVRKMNTADDDESLQSAESTTDVGNTRGNVQVAGPIPAGVYKVKDIYSQILCVKSPDYSELTRFRDALEEYVRSSRIYDGVLVQYDFN
jgi:primosomal protein N' (replication factor Y)